MAALGWSITRHGGGAAIPRAKEARSGLVFDIARKRCASVSSSASVRSGWGLGMVGGLVMFLLELYLGHQSVNKPNPYLSVLQSYWNLHVWNRKEALFLSSVSRYLGLSIVFISDLEYFALLSSWCPWCRGEQDYH